MTWHNAAQAVTLIGDHRVLLGLSVVFAGILHWREQDDLATAWLGALILCLTMIALSKVIGYTFVRRTPTVPFISVSDHAAFSTFFYLSISVVARRAVCDRRHRLIAATMMFVVGTVAATRLILDLHTIWEVLAGVAIGLVAIFAFVRARRDDTRWLWLYWSALIAAIGFRITLSYQPVSLEDMVQWIGIHLAGLLFRH